MNASRPLRNRYTPQRHMSQGLLYLVATILTLLFTGPFIWAILSSLKGPAEIYQFPPTWFPQEVHWENYSLIWEMAPLARFYANTILITVLATLGTLISATLVAYGFARFEFPGRDFLFLLVISTLILPDEVTIVPRFLLFRTLGWLDTYLPLTVPFYFGNAFSIFLLRQFIRTIPRALDEAAEIDGANELRILWNILLPIITPALATIAIFASLDAWNDFLHPLIFLRTTEKFTLALGLRFFQTTADMGGTPREAFLMAASLVVTLPPILLFISAQRYFIRGIALSGIKG
jgi:multiple sugar transport system permease protein